MDAALWLGGVALLVAGALVEAQRLLAAPGIAITLGVCLAAYVWFLASTRRTSVPSQGRKR
jgi:hypothetical protein